MNVKKITPSLLPPWLSWLPLSESFSLIARRNLTTRRRRYVPLVVQIRQNHPDSTGDEEAAWPGRRDPKEEALAEARCLNPHPEQVTDPEFLASDFFDARDAVQVKYEMVRKVRAGGAPVTEAAAAFGYSRPAYYAAAAALESSGLEGLVPARPGPRGGHKLTEEILAWAEEQLAADPALRPAQLPDLIEDAFGVRVHPRSVERALARRRERHSKSR